MSEMIGIKRVVLNERHLRPGRTRHTIADRSGTREFPPFISLMIAQHPGHASCYLMHICEDGGYADTYHEKRGDRNLGTESAGINRNIVGDARALRKRRSDSIPASSLACDPVRGCSEA